MKGPVGQHLLRVFWIPHCSPFQIGVADWLCVFFGFQLFAFPDFEIGAREFEWERITRDSTVLKNVTTWGIRFPGYYVIQKQSLRRYRGKLLLYNLLVRRHNVC
jgi:hypothetical protein